MAKAEEKFEEFSAGEEFYKGQFSGLTIDPEAAMEWHLLFLGVSPGTLHIGYREFVDGSIRKSFTLTLSFLLPTQHITVKGKRFEISRADNDGLEVRHLPEDLGPD